MTTVAINRFMAVFTVGVVLVAATEKPSHAEEDPEDCNADGSGDEAGLLALNIAIERATKKRPSPSPHPPPISPHPAPDASLLGSSMHSGTVVKTEPAARLANIATKSICHDLPGAESGTAWFDGWNGCDGYAANPWWCGWFGGTDYNGEGGAVDKCCACGGGSTGHKATCEDLPGAQSGNAWFDGWNGCGVYAANPSWCEWYGVNDYNGEGKANDKCCGCGGGKTCEADDEEGGMSSSFVVSSQQNGSNPITGCHDVAAFCNLDGMCGSYKATAKYYCPRTCGLCVSTRCMAHSDCGDDQLQCRNGQCEACPENTYTCASALQKSESLEDSLVRKSVDASCRHNGGCNCYREPEMVPIR